MSLYSACLIKYPHTAAVSFAARCLSRNKHLFMNGMTATYWRQRRCALEANDKSEGNEVFVWSTWKVR